MLCSGTLNHNSLTHTYSHLTLQTNIVVSGREQSRLPLHLPICTVQLELWYEVSDYTKRANQRERERERERAIFEYSCDTILVTIYHLVFVFVLSEVSLSRLELDLSLANEIAC